MVNYQKFMATNMAVLFSELKRGAPFLAPQSLADAQMLTICLSTGLPSYTRHLKCQL